MASAPVTKGVGLADLCIKRPVFATMVNLFIVVLGWFSLGSIGIDQFPNVELPIVTVTTTLRGASPEEMETSVTKPLEEIINTIQGIDELSSVTTEGVSQITITFLLERNRDIAAQDVRDKVNTVLAQLPLAMADAIAAALAEAGAAAVYPAHDQLLVDETGAIWLREDIGPRRGREEPRRWVILGADGVWHGTITTPARFEVHQVTADRVIGVWRDDFDVEHLRIHRLER